MRLFRRPELVSIALVLALAGTGAARAQEIVQAMTPDADALASEMRVLAVDPLNLNAMIRAGELTLKLDDATAAAGFFARAERIDPSNPRIKAGQGSLLVQAGRPGEALRRFAEAVVLRGDVRRFAADRGLAYDLIGEQERAQRDYRLALREGSSDGPRDETLRRYALSLGISGNRDEALLQLDPLLRKSDRGAWRARAFILAMTGDSPGAERIATSMMPGGMAQGLQPFFRRLPQLGAIDRAFAVHFGEVHTTPQRIADARLAPPMAQLLPEPGRPVTVASNAYVVPKAGEDKKRDRKKKRRGRDRIDAITAAAPVPLPQPPVYAGQPVEIVQAVPQPQYPPLTRDAAPLQLAAARPVVVTPVLVPRREVVQELPKPAPDPVPEPMRVAAAPVVPAPSGDTPQPLASERVAVPVAEPVRAAPVVIAAVPSPQPPAPAPVQPPVQVAAAPLSEPAPAPTTQQPDPTAPTIQRPVVTAAAPAPVPIPGPARGEDSILARIIANIDIPGEELGVEPLPVAAAPVRVEPAPVTAARAPVDQRAIDPQVVADQQALDRAANEKAEKARLAAEKKLADKKAADKKAADAKKAEELRKKNDPKLLEPSRIWVQVAGGANESTLTKEWAKVRDKAPGAFKGKSGWTTPLRLTNRVLAGPFKTDGEARSFVNALAKEGISAFTFTSDAGQKITKLAAK